MRLIPSSRSLRAAGANVAGRVRTGHLADLFTAGMLAYPGRTLGQLHHRLFRANDLRDGFLAGHDRVRRRGVAQGRRPRTR